MNEALETNVCPLCAEVIKSAAKVCPHCRHWQKKWSLQNPLVMMNVWAVFWLVLLACLVTFVEKTVGPKREFGPYQDQIVAINSEFSHRMSGSNLWVTVVGVVTNRSDFAWKNVGLEAQFFDRQGKLIDVDSHTRDYDGFTILPHAQQAFKIEGKAARPQTEYVGHKVTVRWAKDANALF
ncbi:MAG: hypothetical protein HY043_06895 [Verrucomicrobia bacterium]|nr:hypothetical protein [Verrucomicrobiota bacterium]